MDRRIGDIILKQWEDNLDKIFLKSYHNKLTYTGEQASNKVKNIALAYVNYGLDAEDKIGIYSQNLPDWTLVDLAANISNIISVPIFATNNANQTDFIIKDAKIKILFVGEQQQYNEALKISDIRDIQMILFDKEVKIKDSTTLYLEDWIKKYSDSNAEQELLKRKDSADINDTATLIYTSGTTGRPKGVILQNLQFVAMLKNHKAVYDFSSEYRSLAFLPLSHVFERGWTYLVLAVGMQNIYLNNPRNIAEALEEVKPHALSAVPRLYDKVYTKVLQTINDESATKQKVFNWAVEQGKVKVRKQEKKQALSFTEKLKLKIADKLVFQKIRNKLGGNLVFTPCGGAYIPNEIVLFFHAIGMPILVGYGLTESTATVTSFTHQDFKVGSVGLPMNPIEVKIGDNSEILVKGDTISPGYYERPKENEESFTADGFFKTGDAGKFDEDGYLIITDRIKELIKTAGGKYIAPQLVESQIVQSPFIQQVMIVGEGKPYASALIVPDYEYLEIWTKKRNIAFNSKEEVLENKQVYDEIYKSFKETQKELSEYERAKKFRIVKDEFTMENEELTPTLKLKRKNIKQRYMALIDQMYNKA